MRGERNQVIYDLVYVTKHKEGFKTMKKAMWRVRSAEDVDYIFSDKVFNANSNESVTWLRNDDWQKLAAQRVEKQFSERSVSLNSVIDYVWLKTPFPYQAKILQVLEEQGKITVITKNGETRRKNTYPKEKIKTIKFTPLRQPFIDTNGRPPSFVQKKGTVLAVDGKENIPHYSTKHSNMAQHKTLELTKNDKHQATLNYTVKQTKSVDRSMKISSLESREEQLQQLLELSLTRVDMEFNDINPDALFGENAKVVGEHRCLLTGRSINGTKDDASEGAYLIRFTFSDREPFNFFAKKTPGLVNSWDTKQMDRVDNPYTMTAQKTSISDIPKIHVGLDNSCKTNNGGNYDSRSNEKNLKRKHPDSTSIETEAKKARVDDHQRKFKFR